MRALVARAVEESSGEMPVAVFGWHLSQRLADPLLVIAASPRMSSGISPAQEIIIETGFQLLVDVLLYVASDHRKWALARLPAGSRERKRAEAELGNLLFDVEGQGALAAYLRELYEARLNVSARKGGSVRLLRLRP
jgi:predicted ATPase